MKVLQLSCHFYPNVGGVETHLNDLIVALIKRGYEVVVLTYQPLTTKVNWQAFEKSWNLTILRIPWIPGFFYKFVSIPILEFLYLLPGLFLVTPIVIAFANPNIIHAHGLVAGFIGVFWGRLFDKRVIVSAHSVYHFPQKGLYKEFAAWIFQNADFCLGLSKQAAKEIKSLGVPSEKVDNFTYWIDLKKFKKIEKNAKNSLGWKDKFIVLFVGRLIKEKGVLELLESAKRWDKSITLVIIGTGPLEDNIKYQISNIKDAQYLGKTDNDKLPLYYSGADILIVPSIHEEGFGRVILEALACGVPVIGSHLGAIPQALDETVGKLIDINPKNIKDAVEYLFTHPQKLKDLSKNARKFAERRYSEKNAETIIKAYKV